MKPKKITELSDDYESKIYQEKIDGGSVVIDVKLPQVDIIHARSDKGNIIWNKRSYRYPELVKEIQQGDVLKDNVTYIGELTALDKDGIGRLWTFGRRSHLENNFQIMRMSKLVPVVFFPHHIIQDNEEMLDTITYEEILQMLSTHIKEGDHIRNIPTFKTPQPLLEKKGTIEGIVVKTLSGTYHIGKRGMGWEKLKFLKEKTVKFISYERQEIGIKLYTDDNKPVHLAGHRVDIAVEKIETNGYVMAEIEFFMETNLGYRDCSIKRIGNLKKIEV